MAVVWVLLSLAASGALPVFAYECYDHSCIGDGCLERAVADGSADTCMAQTELGCMVMVTADRELAGCVTETCNDLYSPAFTQYCCDQDRCNANTKPVTKPGDNCYSVTCDTKGCVAAAVDAGKAAYCAKPSGRDCFFSITQTGPAGSHTYQESSQCITTECQSLTTRTADDNFSQQTCCPTPLCNDGKELAISEDQCYSMTCTGAGEDCIKTAPSIGLTPGRCKMDQNYGCYFIAHPGGAAIEAGCSSPENGCLRSLTGQVRKQCCHSHLCNDDLELEPKEVGCYQFNCTGDGCSEGIVRSKSYQLCTRQSGSVCKFTLIKKSDPTQGSAVAECASGICFPGKRYHDNGTVTTVSCCNTDTCNDRIDALQDPDVDRCYYTGCQSHKSCFDKETFEFKEDTTFCYNGEYRNRRGCIYQMSYHKGWAEVSVECNDEPICQSFARYINSSAFDLRRCCLGDNCNNGPREENPATSCYETMCQGTNCVKDAVQDNVFLYCPMSGDGCVTSTGEAEMGNTTVLVTKSGCAQTKCVVGQATEPGFKTVACCDKHLCISDVTPTSGGNSVTVTTVYLSCVAFIILVLTFS